MNGYKKSRYLCPHCGAILYYEKPGATRDNYPFVCLECDENFFRIECVKATGKNADKGTE